MSEQPSIDTVAHGESSPTEAERASQDAFIARVWEKYNAGVPLYTKAMIRFAQQQTSQFPLPREVSVLGYDDKLHVSNLLLSRYDEHEIYLPRLLFESIEHLTSPSPDHMLKQVFSAIWIGGVCDPVLNQGSNLAPDTVRRAFEADIRLWEESTTWERIRQCIVPHLAGSSKIDKIIGFGLGIITGNSYDAETNTRKDGPCTQHALMVTLARFLESRTGRKVACFAQEPAYLDTCKAVLGGMGVEVLRMEDGFLLADDSSVVLSFSPNIPVRQVIADLARPAIMIWNRIVEKKGEQRWKLMDDGVWMSPHTTDPVSARVVAMAKDYVETVVDDEFIKGTGIYVRRDSTTAY